MAAIVDPDNCINMAVLATALDRVLPSYARPIFIRAVKQMDLTGTFKLKKVDLQKEGFNPSLVKDDIYFRKGKTFVPLTLELYSDIVFGKEKV